MNEVEHKIDFDEKGNPILKKKTNVKRGSKSRAAGSLFERRVRKDLEEKGWIVDKWSNNIDFEQNEIIPSKRVFKKFKSNMGVLTIGTGFPDFVCFQKMNNYYKIVGVEVKMNGLLKKEEKEKCAWYLKNNIFNEIWIAMKEFEGKRIKIVYKDISKIYPKISV